MMEIRRAEEFPLQRERFCRHNNVFSLKSINYYFILTLGEWKLIFLSFSRFPIKWDFRSTLVIALNVKSDELGGGWRSCRNNEPFCSVHRFRQDDD